MGWTDSSGILWLFGGSGYDSAGNFGYLNDLWAFNPSLAQWVWQGGSNKLTCYTASGNLGSYCGQSGQYGSPGSPSLSNAPGGREAPDTWLDPSGNVWLFGGLGLDSTGNVGYLDDLWEMKAGEWIWIGGNATVPGTYQGAPAIYGNKGAPAPGNIPSGRESSASWIDSAGNLWLFGGYYATSSSTGWLNDFWKYDQSLGQWEWIGGSNQPGQPGVYGILGEPATANEPGARAGASGWIDASGQLGLFGGNGYDTDGVVGELSDVWVFNPTNSEWAWSNGSSVSNRPGDYGTLEVPNPSNSPGSRDGASSWVDSNGNFRLFGGEGLDASGTFGSLNDMWILGTPAAKPALSLSSGTYNGPQSITIADSTAGALIYYTLDGSIPSAMSAQYIAPVSINISQQTLRAVAIAPGFVQSDVASATYTLLGLPAASAPMFSPPAGTYTTPQSVTITDSTPGATIYYTTGAAPSTNSTLYTQPITVSSTETLRVLVAAPGYAFQTASAAYTIDLPQTAQPVLSPSGGTYTAPAVVTITSATPGAEIYYAIGTAPTTASTLYSGPVSVSATETLETIAVAPGYAASSEVSATFVIDALAATLTVTGSNPYTMACSLTGSGSISVPSPAGTVSFSDLSTGDILGSTALGTSNVQRTTHQVTNLVGNGPGAIVSGDFNQDGKLDLATANTFDGTISILLGNGDGTFQPQSLLQVNGFPENLVAGDFNNDGFIDLAATVNGSGVLSIFLGNGNGTFTQTSSSPSTGVASSLALAADFNGDGIPDLVANGLDGEVYLLLGNGDGTFQTPISTAAGFSTSGTVAADFNGDGKMDLIGPSGGSTPLTLLAGNGDGTFSVQPILASEQLAGTPIAMTNADFNGDNKQDLAVFTFNESNSVTVLLGNGDGTFTYSSNHVLAIPNPFYPATAVTGTFGTRSAPGIAVTNTYGSDVMVFAGNGDGTLTAPSSFPAGSFPTGLIVSDLDGDGVIDFAVADIESNTVSVALDTVVASGSGTLADITVELGAAATHNLQCSYSGDSHYGPSISNIVTKTFTATAKPALALAGSSTPGTQSVAMTDASAQAQIYYTTNGSVPSTSSTRYFAPIQISSGTVLSAIAIAPGHPASAVASAAYSAAAPPQFLLSPADVASGVSSATSRVVTITDPTPGTVIYYTTDGSTPSSGSAKYVKPLMVASSATIKAFAAATTLVNSSAVAAVKLAWPAPSAIVYGTLLTAKQLDAVSSVEGAFTYSPNINALLVAGTNTLNANFTPSGSTAYGSTKISVRILVDRAQLKVTATDVSLKYGLTLPALHYTIQGFVNHETSEVVTGAPKETTTARKDSPPGTYPISLTIGTLAAKNYEFVLKNGTVTIAALGKVAAPAFKPATGVYSSPQTVVISDADAGVTIYYALHGDTPNTSSTKYTRPISVRDTETFKAIAVKPGYTNSLIATAKYSIQSSSSDRPPER